MRKVKKIILILICVFMCTNTVYGANGSFSDIWSGGSGDGSGGGGSPGGGGPGNGSPGSGPGGNPTEPEPDPGIDGHGSTAYVTSNNDGTPGSSGHNKPPYSNDGTSYPRYICYYKHNISINTSIDVNAYDMNGNSLIPHKLITDKKFKSGTWIGINITEVKSAKWKVNDFRYVELKKTYKCRYNNATEYTQIGTVCTNNCTGYEGQNYNGKIVTKVKVGSSCGFTPCTQKPCQNITTKKNCTLYTSSSYTDTVPYEVAAGTEAKCPIKGGKEGTVVDQKIVEKEIYSDRCPKEIQDAAAVSTKDLAEGRIKNASNKMEFYDDNGDEITITAKINEEKSKEEVGEYGYSGTINKVYEYRPQTVCIDLIKANVTYHDTYPYCKTSSDEKKVEDGVTWDQDLEKEVTYWHYFVPLNKKTGETAAVSLAPNIDHKLTENQCLNGMKNKNTKDDPYTSYIKPIQGEFIGLTEKGEASDSDVNLVKNQHGCQMAIVVNFGVKQLFYGENVDNSKLKGYGMYFRQIDISNPFPNGLNDNLYWSGLYDASTKKITVGEKTIKLTDFDKITYKAKISNSAIKTIATFNNNPNNPYTKWKSNYGKTSGMNVDGTSNFIKNNKSIFTTTAKTSSFYNLGCSELNVNRDRSICKK